MSKINEFFDNAENIVKRSRKLLLMIVGAIVAVFGALYVGLDQIAPEEDYTPEPIEYMEGDSLDTLGYDTEPYEMMTEDGS